MLPNALLIAVVALAALALALQRTRHAHAQREIEAKYRTLLDLGPLIGKPYTREDLTAVL